MKNTMTMNAILQRLAQAVVLAAVLASASADGQTATQYASGYSSPGTITITNTFSYPVGQQCVGLIWGPIVPAGWTITNVRGNGGGPELGWDGYILFTAYTIPNPVVMLYDVVVPAGETGPKNIEADVYYDLGPGLIATRATPDPFVLENLVKTLQVVSQYGAPMPAVGSHSHLAGTALSPSVDASVYLGATQYVCTGWSMTGNEPASGTTNAFFMTVTSNAVLTWNWSYYNTAPAITAAVDMVGLRTKINTIQEAKLLSVAADPDTGDTLTLVSVQTNCASGATVIWSGGSVGYVPPATNRLGLTDLIPFTVKDSRGAETTGVLKVKTLPVGVMIRVF